ncbi:hypothetical protein JKF63_07265 [Porcisia hertigi]|uniref:Trafficking protein particle complex subunit 13 N-terminal domain-containing protein n=1 Tax=Porcisia hertigi TaxID=2761500 RepID=A0A837A9K1_9TRYP|nr:hypothetical protein JKF63_07265 [Porcisia hertigi]
MKTSAASSLVTAATESRASSAAQQGPSNGATTTNVTAAADGTVMLTAPLGLQATLLSQPLFFPSFGEDFGDITEEGDILFSVLGDPWSRVRCGQPLCGRSTSPSSMSPQQQQRPTRKAAAVVPVNRCFSTSLWVQPVLTLPRKVGVLLASEVFRALLCFHNAANYTLTQAHFHIGVTQPQTQLQRGLLRQTVATLPPKSHYTVVASVLLRDVSAYALAVVVDYVDPSGRQRQLTWNSSFNTEQPIREAQPRCLRYVRPTWATLKNQLDGADDSGDSSPRLSTSLGQYALYQLSIGLKNMSSVPLCLAASELVLPSLTHHCGATVFREVAANGRHTESVTAPVLLMPGDTHTLLFTVGILLEELRHATVVHGRGGTKRRLLSSRLASLGHVRWTWCRANGETGTIQSAPLRVEQLFSEAEVELGVTHITAGSADHPATQPPPVTASAYDDGGVASADYHRYLLHEHMASTPLIAGSPVTAHFKVLNHSHVHRYDLAVKVRVERLAPHWLYTGPTVRLLGLLGSASSLSFSLTLLPWQAGWLHITREAIELFDARASDVVRWPPSAEAFLQPVSVEGGISLGTATSDTVDGSGETTLMGTAPAIAAVAMKALPAVDGDTLCNVLVL